MKDIEQDQDVHRDPLSGHICQHNQKDGAEKENEDEVRATHAQSFDCSSLGLELEHLRCSRSSQDEDVEDENEDET